MAMLPKTTPQCLEARGVQKLELCPGWENAGSSGRMGVTAIGFVLHHTASAYRPGNPKNDAPSLGLLRKGRGQPSPLPPPVVQLFQSRSNVVWLIAAGVSNHAGKGSGVVLEQVRKGEKVTGSAGSRHLQDTIGGNSYFGGLEVEHAGTEVEAWSDDRVLTMCRVAAGVADAIGRGPNCVISHMQWTRRKSDPSVPERVWMEALREIMGDAPGYNKPASPPSGPSKPFTAYTAAEWAKLTGDGVLSVGDSGEPVRRLQTLLNMGGARLVVDGSYGQGTALAVIDHQTARGAKPGAPGLGTVGLWSAASMGLAKR